MKPKLLTKPIVGQAALREAAAGSFEQIMSLVFDALRVIYALGGDVDIWPYLLAVFPDSVVVTREGKNWRYPYSYDLATNTITLGGAIASA